MTVRAWGWIALLLLLAAGGGATWLRCEGTPPAVQAPEEAWVGREGATVKMSAEDPGSGLRSIRVSLRHAGGERQLLDQHLVGGLLRGTLPPREPHAFEVALDPKALGLKEGDAFLEVEVRDWSWRDLFRGNATTLEVPLRVDLRRPRVAVETGLTYVQRGGSGLVVYRLDEPAARDGVQVADDFYPGHPLPGGGANERVALFAVARNAPASPRIRVVAADRAGNTGTGSWNVQLLERSFDEVPIHLSERFLTGKVPELAEEVGIEEKDPVRAFQLINSEQRAHDEARIKEVVKSTGDEPLFRGAFQQMKNSAVTSRFAEHRSYFVNREQVSEAIHYGYDLASTAGAPIEASNRGRVIHAGDLGIYGGCVILDHGLGLASLYGHLSSIDVEVGDLVEKGATLGRSGSTGLAGGDHLHFAILVDGTYVDPKEWWDPKWVRDHLGPLAAGEKVAGPRAGG